jgi:hypothetical protein
MRKGFRFAGITISNPSLTRRTVDRGSGGVTLIVGILSA